MRKVIFDGYIEDMSDFEADITPKKLRESLYGEDGSLNDDVDILLNSYGGSCNAAVKMFDILKDYPGHTKVTISGTAASAATVFVQGADEVVMTPGSLMMIHDPLTIAFGNKASLKKAMEILDTCKESIINMYKARSPLDREEISKLMSRETWMDASDALANGFVDAIVGAGVQNRVENIDAAKMLVDEWKKRHGYPVNEDPEEEEEAEETGEPEEETEDKAAEAEEDKPEEEEAEEGEPEKEEQEEEKPEEEERDEADQQLRDDIFEWLLSLPY